ncbi:MAG: cell division ATP-binding protein FtsE [bacterium]|nr:cell division ATP-binding protein FtsE [bacterium]MDA1024753.1 cell division ATP-binding protein FtsE [bacterium]
MIHLKGVSKTYQPNIKALQNISLNVKPGEFVSIVGQSGSGKSTLAKMLFAEERPTKGEVVIGEWDISKIKQADVPTLRRQIGVVFQDFKLLPRKTAAENIAFALEVAGEHSARMKEIVGHVLKIVGLEEKANRYPRQLSGGEQQRVSIARSLVHRPKLIIADEPTGNLDAIHAQEIIHLLKKINEFGTTVVLVTHDRDIVNGLKKRVVTLQNGEIASDVARGKYVLS